MALASQGDTDSRLVRDCCGCLIDHWREYPPDAQKHPGDEQTRPNRSVHCLLHCVSKQEKAHNMYVLFAPRLGIIASFRRSIGWYLFVVVVLGCCGRFRLLPRLLMRALLVASCVRPQKAVLSLLLFCPFNSQIVAT